jgi:hypothetical protein
VEFALTLPIWIILLLGSADGTYALLVNEKVDRIAYTITDIVTQYQTINLANLADIVQAGGQLMKPFDFTLNGVVIITSAYKPTGKTPKVCWQYVGGGSLSRGSAVGSVGGAPVLPNGLILNDNDNVIITEVYYKFSPLFVSSFTKGDVYRAAVYKPRLSPLINPPTGGSC